MRYLVQILRMLGDVLFLFMMGLGMYAASTETNILLSVITVFVMWMALKQWDQMGGFDAWKPSKIKVFLSGAKKLGM